MILPPPILIHTPATPPCACRWHRRGPVCRVSGRISAAAALPQASGWRVPRASGSSRPSRAPLVLAVHGGDVDLLGLLRRVRMLGVWIDAEIAKLAAAERAVRQH